MKAVADFKCFFTFKSYAPKRLIEKLFRYVNKNFDSMKNEES